jgi:L-lactate dehydrogenase complex protein LldE
MRVALFIPCFVDQFYPEVGKAMVAVLRRVGVEVCFPSEQTCCGQPAFNTGYWDEARTLAKRYCEIFNKYDAIVSPSGSCTAMVRNFYPELLSLSCHSERSEEPRNNLAPMADHSEILRFAQDDKQNESVARVCANTFEFSEFLVKKLSLADVGAKFPAKVTYHDSCHTLRELRLKEEPRTLLRAVQGLELVEMTEAETCCGFGGTFSVKFPTISTAMDDVKCQSIVATGAQYVVSVDSSCLMQIGGWLRRRNLPVQTKHLAEVLAQT